MFHFNLGNELLLFHFPRLKKLLRIFDTIHILVHFFLVKVIFRWITITAHRAILWIIICLISLLYFNNLISFIQFITLEILPPIILWFEWLNLLMAKYVDTIEHISCILTFRCRPWIRQILVWNLFCVWSDQSILIAWFKIIYLRCTVYCAFHSSIRRCIIVMHLLLTWSIEPSKLQLLPRWILNELITPLPRQLVISLLIDLTVN